MWHWMLTKTTSTTVDLLQLIITAASSCRRATFLQLFHKFIQSPQSPTLTQKFLCKFFCSIAFKNVQIFYQNLIFIAETHVYTKLSSATKQNTFGIRII